MHLLRQCIHDVKLLFLVVNHVDCENVPEAKCGKLSELFIVKIDGDYVSSLEVDESGYYIFCDYRIDQLNFTGRLARCCHVDLRMLSLLHLSLIVFLLLSGGIASGALALPTEEDLFVCSVYLISF